MSRKDFIHIAGIIKSLKVNAATRLCLAVDFANGLESTNSQFKRELFIQAATGIVPVTARKTI